MKQNKNKYKVFCVLKYDSFTIDYQLITVQCQISQAIFIQEGDISSTTYFPYTNKSCITKYTRPSIFKCLTPSL